MAEKKLTCLLVDDDPDDLQIFSLVLREIHPTVECFFAPDGYYALQKLNSDPHFIPGFIILDFNVPRMDGVQCLIEIKKISRLSAVPVFMYSTHPDGSIASLCKKLGAADFIIKSSKVEDIKKALLNILSRIS